MGLGCEVRGFGWVGMCFRFRCCIVFGKIWEYCIKIDRKN